MPDTLVHVQAAGHGRTRVYWQEMRWSSKLHGKTTHLTWADGESFTVDERQEITEDTMVEEMLEAVREVAGASWTTIIDVADGTAATHKVNLSRIVPRLGARTLDSLEAADVATLVEELNEAGLKRESIRKTIAALAMIFDYAKVVPNAARDRTTIKLPREDKVELNPPTAEHVLAVHRLVTPAYRLPLIVLDASGMRVGELEALTWGDVDEPRARWRVSQAVAKTGRARWVHVPEALFQTVTDLVPREDRDLDGQVFAGFSADRLRTAIGRSCKAAGIPSFSPHDLRHRRISLLHLSGVPWARIGEAVGQRNLAVTANTYTHVLADEKEVDYSSLGSLSSNRKPTGAIPARR